MSTVTTRPDSTVTADGTLVGAATRHAALADDSDSSYVTLDPTDLLRVGFPIPSIPAGGRMRAINMRVRVRYDTIGSAFLTVVLDDGSGQFFWGGASVSFATPTTVTLKNPPGQYLTDLPADLFGTFGNDAGGGRNTRLVEVYLDAIYVAKPVVDATTPTGTIATNLPTVAWSNTLDSDGGDQTAFEVRVFTDAQYGAGGFNAASSPATWESGVISSADTAATLDEILADDTYRAYVRVAQSVAGELLWSDFDYTQFTVDAPQPAAPDLALVADNDNGRVQIDLAANSGDVATDVFEVQRSDDGGTTWATIRTLTTNGLIDLGDGTITVYDYEAPIGVEVTYRARALAGITVEDSPFIEPPSVSDWATDTVTWTSSRQWLKAASTPELNLAVTFISAPGHARAARRGVFQPLGRSDAIAVNDTRAPKQGDLKIAVDPDDLDTFEALIDTGLPIFVQAPASHKWPDRWVSFGDEDASRLVDKAWSAEDLRSLGWTEVVAPADPLVAWE